MQIAELRRPNVFHPVGIAHIIRLRSGDPTAKEAEALTRDEGQFSNKIVRQ
jgi:hypothetical protein